MKYGFKRQADGTYVYTDDYNKSFIVEHHGSARASSLVKRIIEGMFKQGHSLNYSMCDRKSGAWLTKFEKELKKSVLVAPVQTSPTAKTKREEDNSIVSSDDDLDLISVPKPDSLNTRW